MLANLYLNPLDWAVNERVRGQPVLVRYADDFVILCGPGRGKQLRARLGRWLTAKGLTLNERKTRLVNFREEGFHFLGFALQERKAAVASPVCTSSRPRQIRTTGSLRGRGGSLDGN